MTASRRHPHTALLLAALAGLALPALAQPAGRSGRQPPPEPARAAPAAGDKAAATPMPIRAITLYRSGVGYFERRATVEGDEQIQLRFATDQINDILKSMVILDVGGQVGGVSYGSKDPLQRRLASFGINIADNPTAGEILSRLRGTRVRVETSEGQAEGIILNVEKRPTVLGGGPSTPQSVVELPWINLLGPSGVKSFNLTQVHGFQVLDEQLDAELKKALAALAEHSADRVKTVDLSFTGRGAREAIVAYVHEMPLWKTSYRLILADQPEGRKDPKAAEGGQPTIQGWAIVENTTDEDWENVKLSLVAGRPVSFQMDLYEPLHIERPDIPVPVIAAARPKIYQDAEAFAGRMELEARAKNVAPASPAPAAMRRLSRGAIGPGERDQAATGFASGGIPISEEKALSADDLTRYAAQAQGQAGEIGEVFQYQLKAPVSLARQRSAMLPILSSPIEGRRVSIYNRGDNPEHPMRGVELKNTSGLQLMPGPLSVFDGPAYAGDAQIGHITLGDKRLLAYAVDLDVSALAKQDSTSAVRKVRIVHGLIEQTIKQESKVAYAFTNKDAKRPRTVLVEHPKVPAWDLVEPKKAGEETEALYRFELALAPGDSGKLDVAQEHTELQSIAVTGYDLGTLAAYVKQGKASPKVLEAVQKAADMQAAVTETERRIQVLDAERTTIDQDQARIRQNMQSMARDAELYRRYMGKLNDQETRLEALRDQREKEQATLTRQRQELESYIRSLNVE